MGFCMFTRPGIQAMAGYGSKENPTWWHLTGAAARGLSNLLLGNGWLGTTVGRGGDLSKTIEYPRDP